MVSKGCNKPNEAIPILDNLFSDKTRYVTRSVAKHINDISKIDPALAIDTLKKWKESSMQDPTDVDYIISHALRTLIKKGNIQALMFLNLSPDPQVTLANFHLSQDQIHIGDSLEFHFTLTAHADEQIIVDYELFFPNKAGQVLNRKVFKIKKISMKKGQSLTIVKRHPLRANMTTRRLIPGEHKVEVQINGTKLASEFFVLSS